MDYSHQPPLSTGFSGQEYWSGLPFPSPKDLPDPGIEPTSPPLAGRLFFVCFFFFTTEPLGKPKHQTGYRNLGFIFNLCLLPTKNCHWTSASVKVKSLITAVPGLQHTLKELKEIRMRHSVLWENLAEWTFRELDIFWRGFYELLASSLIYKSTKSH